jgi:hypothetical protein
MPVTYQIDAERGLIRTRRAGPVTPRDAIAHFTETQTLRDLGEAEAGLDSVRSRPV